MSKRNPSEKELQTQSKLIAEQLEIARNAIKKAMKLADKYGQTFRWEPPALCHGEGTHMGGYYYGEGNERRPASFKEWTYGDPHEDGWLPSNQSC
jgi:hypothetical protein